MLLFHFLNAEFGLKDLRERRLKVSRLDDLNDPFEFLGAELSDRGRRKALYETRAELSKTCGLICFSGNWRNPTVWSHYADRHKGICLGFEVSESEYVPRVDYVSSRFRWPGILDENFVRKLLYTKFSHWRYEDEYRLFVSLKDEENGRYYLNFSESLLLRTVIVGAESEISQMQVHEALGSLASAVNVFKVRPAFRSFKIVRNMDESLWK